MKEIFVSPSIIAANFCEIGKTVSVIEDSGAEWVHCDVMDGLFVPNITFGQKMISDIRGITNLVLDVHLMISNPERYIEQFAEGGADIITIHIESTENVMKALEKIKACGKLAGLAIKPLTPVNTIKPYIDIVDMILVMSVEPGFSGQLFIPDSLNKIKDVRKLIEDKNKIIQVDGGINASNIKSIVDAGADSVVAGTTFFNSDDKKEAVNILKCLKK